MKQNYSVLMAVYYKDDPAHFRAAIESMLGQTAPTDDFVLVCDGPLTPELDAVIGEYEGLNCFHTVRLEENSGLGNALNAGLKRCKNELVARMDSDDLSCPDRCEKQLDVFGRMPELAVCGGIIEEFTNDPMAPAARRVTPEMQEEILAFARKRNPFNHPSVMFRRSAVEAAGGYQELYLLEDYYLWVRMLLAGYTGYNIQQPLLHMRTGEEMYNRRAGRKYARSQRELLRYMRDSGFMGNGRYVMGTALRMISSTLPNRLRKKLFMTFLREN